MAYDTPFEHRPNSGTAFIHDKGDNPERPDFKGDGIFHGIPSWWSLWKKKTKAGDTYCSIELQAKDEKSQTSLDGKNFPKDGRIENIDDIPF